MKSNMVRNPAVVLARQLSVAILIVFVAIVLSLLAVVGFDRVQRNPLESLLVFGLPVVFLPFLVFIRLRTAIPESVTVGSDIITLDFIWPRRTKTINAAQISRLELRKPSVWSPGSTRLRWVHLHWGDASSRRRRLVFPVAGEVADDLAQLRFPLRNR